MLYIKGLKFRGFKSFRKAEANFQNGYVCLAGPNGSGKSNVTDGIRFALGEGSLKALRARRVAELVNTSCKYAEVTLFIDGEKQYEIKRAINSEGKTLYRINGKRSTRTLVMEEMRQYGLEAGGHNIIAQGQVQKIVEMSAKERRGIIDQVAGISEFDAKKEEALRELAKVEQKITEATIVLGEREAHLTELEKEKNDALSYISAKENFNRAQASLTTAEFTRLNKSHTDLVQKHVAITEEKEELTKQVGVLNARIAELNAQKAQVVAKMGSSASRENAMKEIEELKVKIGSGKATMSERSRELEQVEKSKKSFVSQLEALRKSQKEVSESISSIEGEERALARQIAELEKKTGASPGAAAELSDKLEFSSQKIISLKERKAALDAAAQNAEKMLQMRREEKERLASTLGSSKEEKLTGERSTLQKELLVHESALAELFEREKEINRAIPELEKRMFSLKDKAATLRATLSPSATSLALRVVDELKAGGMKGIYGAVSSLISCEPKASVAVEAAAGQRLNYVVVDSMNTALKVIEKLKAQKSGRCTFIPLDTVKSPERPHWDVTDGCMGPLLDFVEFSNAYLTAMEYVFSDTLLFENAQSAKKAGIGKVRMITLDGELIERSGIVSGGAQRGSLLSRASLEKVESEANAVKNDRDTLLSQIYSIREDMSARRKEKAGVEVKLKAIEIESNAYKDRMEGAKKAQEALREIEEHMLSIGKEITSSRKEQESLVAQITSAVSEYESLKKKQAAENEKARAAGEESQKKLRELSSRRSSLEAQLQSKNFDLTRLAGELSEKEAEAAAGEGRVSECRKEISALKKEIEECSVQQAEKEKKLAEISSASQKLLDKLRELEGQITEVAGQLGKLKAEDDRKAREQMELQSRREVAEQRLADLKAALEQYAGVPTIDATKAELEDLQNKSRAAMDSIPNPNLRAPEIYEQKKRDIDEIKGRVASLDSEKKAVFYMMDEIEGKKRAIFLSTFSSVNDNFKRLFGYVLKGEGTLLLEQPSNPFESGLLVKVREENGRDKYLDSMSGGEKSLLALIFIFSIQMYKAAPFYILDEADAALDKENSKKLADLIKQLSSKTQFIVVTHNDTVLSSADIALGVTRTDDGSKIVGVQLTSSAMVAKAKKVPQ
ncbi:MAG: AAA family ATPase [Candidatus Micrarchaeia archaeon]